MPSLARLALPLLPLSFPRKVHALHQIEVTSRCDLRCVYCVSPLMVKKLPGYRPAQDMPREIFVRALEHVKYFAAASTQFELNLAGIGESTLHPEFVEFVALARAALPLPFRLVFATNGVSTTGDLVEKLKPYAPRVYVSLHRPEKAGPAVELYRRAGLLEDVSADPSINANTWAGQVAWFNSPDNALECTWLRTGRVMAASDGRLLACCLDAKGAGVVGNVADEIGSLRTAPYGLCKSCHHEIGVAGYDQRGAP